MYCDLLPLFWYYFSSSIYVSLFIILSPPSINHSAFHPTLSPAFLFFIVHIAFLTVLSSLALLQSSLLWSLIFSWLKLFIISIFLYDFFTIMKYLSFGVFNLLFNCILFCGSPFYFPDL